jgi:heme exporter protein D
MSSNPYQPPQSGDARLSRILPRDLGPVTLWTTIVFSLQAVSLLSMNSTEIFLAQRTGGGPPSPEDTGAMLLGLLYLLSALGFLGFYIVGVILFSRWIHRANANAALVSSGLEFTPGWAVGWFFVPLANLFKPYQVVTELYRASDPEADPDYWSIAPVPAFLPLWWASYLGFNAVTNLKSGLFQGSSKVQMGGWLAFVQCALGLLAISMVVLITRSIRRLQEEKVRRSRAGESGSVRTVGNPLLG